MSRRKERREARFELALSKVLTLTDRLSILRASTKKRIPARQMAKARRVVAAWRGRSPFLGSELFDVRLKDIGANEVEVCEALAMPMTATLRNHCRQSPLWKTYFDLIHDHIHSEKCDILFDISTKHDFVRLVHPLVDRQIKNFRQRVEKIVGTDLDEIVDINWVCKRAFDDICDKIYTIIQKVCLLELRVEKLRGRLRGSSSAERYASFIEMLQDANYVSDLFIEYPLLLELVSLELDMWRENTICFLSNFLTNKDSIERDIFDGRRMAKMAGWDMGRGDTHCGGKSVITILFADNMKLVYKPRSLRVDIGFNRLVSWCNNLTSTHALRTVKTIDCGDHGWCEYIDHKEIASIDEAHAFFNRQGKFIALFYLLQAGDMHCENMIASGVDPVYVDLETLFHTPPLQFNLWLVRGGGLS